MHCLDNLETCALALCFLSLGLVRTKIFSLSNNEQTLAGTLIYVGNVVPA